MTAKPGGSHNRRRRTPAGGGEHEGGGMERWLLTYADMITLLMALFIVMWAVSAVNTSKFAELKASLHEAFSGKIMSGSQHVLHGERSILNGDGAQKQPAPQQQTHPQTPPVQLLKPVRFTAEAQDLASLKRVKAQLDSYARQHGFEGRIRTSIDQRGLVIRLLSDELLFDTGQAVLKQRSVPLLRRIATLLRSGKIRNDVRVEGNTDSIPISTPEFRSNWELSTARATAVVEELLVLGMPASRLSAAGYADQRPTATNATAPGRELNRRVDLVVLRRSLGKGEGSS